MEETAHNIINTPGYFYAIAYCISTLVIVFTNERRYKLLIEIVKDILFQTVLYIFMYLTDGVKNVFIISMIIIVFVIYVFLRTSLVAPRRTIVFLCAKTFLYGELMASFAWQVHYFVFLKNERLGGVVPQIVEMAVCYLSLALIQFVFERHLKNGIESLNVKLADMFWAVGIALGVFTISNMSFYSVAGLFSGSTAMDTYIIRTLVDSTGVIALSALHLMLHENQLTFEIYAMKNIMEMQYKNYQISKSSMDMVNRKYHDLKHQIALLREGVSENERLEYLDQIEREISIYETRFQTGNKVLDALLATKASYCQKKKIELKAIVEGNLIGFMDTMDVSALFGNIMDNAIESVEKLDDEALRLINLQVIRDRNFICIRTENYCKEKPMFRNGLPLTSKGDNRFHGYGMKSIKSIVEKYDGSMIAKYKDNWFLLNILIPLYEKQAE